MIKVLKLKNIFSLSNNCHQSGQKLDNRQTWRGFTLLELLLSLALIGILSVASAPLYLSYQTRNDLDVGVNTIVQNLKRAQILSQANDGDTTWGLKIQTGSIVLFKGVSYAARDVTYDESFDLPDNITFAGPQEIIFSKLVGLPSVTGTIILTPVSGEPRSIILNSKGMINY